MNNKLKNSLIIIISIIVIAIINFLICNIGVITNLKEVSVLNQFSHDNNEYSINLNNEYIKKLYIDYESDDNYTLEYTINGIKELDTCTKYINIEVLNINKEVNNISINTPENVNIKDIRIVNKITFNKSIFMLMIVVLLILIGIMIIRKYGIGKIHILFFIMYVGFGSLFVISYLPITGYSWDDQIHYQNIVNDIYIDEYMVSEAERGEYNINYAFPYFNTSEEMNALENYLDSHDKKDIKENKSHIANQYSLSYLPSSLIYNVLKHISINYSLRIKVTKILQIIIYALIICYAIKIIPKYKMLLFTIALIPTSIFISSHFNYDSILLSCVLLGLSSYVRIMNDNKVNKKYLIMSILCFSLGVLNKVVYVPLLLMLLFIPNEKFQKKDVKKYKIIILIVLLLSLSMMIIPSLFLSSDGGADMRAHQNVSPSGQTSFILHNPVQFTNIYFKNAGYNFFERFFGPNTILNLGYVGQPTGSYLYYLFMITILIAFLKACDDGSVIKNKHKIVIGIVLFVIIGFIWGSMYLAFNDVGATIIDGVQGRYFIPLIMPLLLIFINNSIKFKIKDEKLITINTIIITFVYIMIMLGLCIPYTL